MPILLKVDAWGEVQALTLRETAKRMGEYVEHVQWYVDNELLLAYMQSNTGKDGKVKSQTVYVDLIDLADAEKFARRFPPDAPWERILWARYELKQHRQQEEARPDPRTTDRTMVQPARTQKPQPPQPQKPSKLPSQLRNVEFYDDLEARQPSHPPRAQPIRQTVPPADRQLRRQMIEEDDYYAEPMKESRHYPKQPQQRKRVRLW
jgi:hypothetical protein